MRASTLVVRRCRHALSIAPSTKAARHNAQRASLRYLSTYQDTHSIKGVLGVPIPFDEHAVSVALPLWSHVVGYEEGNPAVTQKLALGYPRFVYHPYIRQLAEVWKDRALKQGLIHDKDGTGALPLPTQATAERCRQFILSAHKDKPELPVSVHAIGALDTYIVAFPTAAAGEAKAFWQHSGEILSSRQAQACLHLLGVIPVDVMKPLLEAWPQARALVHARSAQPPREVQAECYSQALRERVGQLNGQDTSQVCLTVSGMAAIFRAFQVCRMAKPGAKAVVFGFPYLDTLKIAQRPQWGSGVHFMGRGDERDMAALETLLKREQVMGVFTEFPSNPLLQVPDLRRLVDLGRRYDFPVVVDDTVGNVHNLDLTSGSHGADVVVSSLTKLFSGKGDVLGGSLVVNASSPFAPMLHQGLNNLASQGYATLYPEDAKALLQNGADFEQRSAKINATTEQLTDWLREQKGVEQLFYPKTTQPDLYHAYMRPTGGYGGLFTLILRDKAAASAFYDALDVYKGPSLGTNFTLCCPYTLLAHYYEQDFVRQHGVDPDLVRVAVGLEPLEHLQYVFDKALTAARKAT